MLTRGQAITGERAEEREAARLRNQADLATFSRHGRQVVAAGSGHHIRIDEPELVVAAIKEVMSATRPVTR